MYLFITGGLEIMDQMRRAVDFDSSRYLGVISTTNFVNIKIKLKHN